MRDVVNLDAMIPREDFASEKGLAAGEKGKAEASKTDLSKGENFMLTLRKPDFQRETAAWSPEAVCAFLKSFVEGELIPAVICWQSASRLTFVIDGAHRLSAVIGWLQDDYGAGSESIKLASNDIPPEQRRVHEKTQVLINRVIGSYRDVQAETQNPGSNQKLTKIARSLGNAKIPLLWVPGNDPKKAERAFLTINQSAVPIDPTEFAILTSRSKPNAISSRVIVRNATGHNYWKDFSTQGQEETVKAGKSIYAKLYSPPLDPPIRTGDLPIAGHGYGTETLPLIFDFVNIANNITVVDASKKSKMDKEHAEEKPDESKTIECLKNTEKLANRFTGRHESSLGLHPAVYFYALNGRHQSTAVLAIGALLMALEDKKQFCEFARVRKDFEEFLINHKMYINQLTGRHGSMAKGFRPMKEYFHLVLNEFIDGKTEPEIEKVLGSHEKYHWLVKDKPVRTSQAKDFSRGVKNVAVLKVVLDSASVCELCHARIDLKAMHIDHTMDRSKGGLGTAENARLLHPFCDSTYKPYLQRGN
jgi:Protein of unknown function DUF262